MLLFQVPRKTDYKNPKAAKTKKEKLKCALSKHAACDTKRLKFIKEQEASGISKSLGIKTTLSF